jgi:hypothetical protein
MNNHPEPPLNISIIPDKDKDDYEIPNGLLGVRRDLFNKLAAHRWGQDEDLQQRYGISKGDLYFKDYFLFKEQRAQKPKPEPKSEPKPQANPIAQPYGNNYNIMFRY